MCRFIYACVRISRHQVRVIWLLAILPISVHGAEPQGLYRPDCNDVWQYEENSDKYMAWYGANCNECSSTSESLIFLDWQARNCTGDAAGIPGVNPPSPGPTDPMPGDPETPGNNSGRYDDTAAPDDKAEVQSAQEIVDILDGVTDNKPSGDSRQPIQGDNTPRQQDTKKPDE